MSLKHGDVIARMTLLEKAALLKGKNMWETWNIVGLPSAFMADGPHGLRKQAGSADNLGLNPSLPATCFPTASCLANSWDESLVEEVGAALGQEAQALDVNVVLGPGLNIKRSPLCGRNFEYFSEDPLLSGKMAAALIRGIQSNGIAACPKHFAANSQELLRMSSDSIVDERTLRELYLTGFEIAVEEGSPKALMSSYNLVNGQYAHENYHLLTEILRGEWGYEGAVISDWGGTNDVVASIANGGSLEMPGGGLESARQIVQAVQSGLLSVETLNQRVDEVIALVLGSRVVSSSVGVEGEAEESGGLGTGTVAKAEGRRVDFDHHHALARTAAERGAVLLKNDGVLPLKPDAKVYLAGAFAHKPRFQGAGSSQVNAYRVDAAADFLPDAVSSLAQADVVLVYLGLDDAAESEGVDRTHINLPPDQLTALDEIARAGKPIVAVVTAGSVIDMTWADKVDAVVHGFLHGQAGAGALVDIIMGRVNPSGKLAETYPLTLADTPTFGHYPSEARTSEYREGLYVGYRYCETAQVPVAYPFGFGLSYTRFDYSDLVVDDTGATFTITNSGAMDGDEIAQLYVTKTGSAVYHPAKELRGFKRVSVKVGESVRVTIPFGTRTFRYFNTIADQWEVEAGEYGILIGASVQDIRLTGAITLECTVVRPRGDSADSPSSHHCESGSLDYSAQADSPGHCADCDSGSLRHSVQAERSRRIHEQDGAPATTPETQDREALAPYFSADIRNVPDHAFASLLGREIPSGEWRVNGQYQSNSALRQLGQSKSWVLRAASRFVRNQTQKIGKDGRPDLNMIFVYDMPLRGFSRNLSAVFTTDMVDGLVAMANGHSLKGLGRVIGGFFRNLTANRRDEKKVTQGRQ